MRRTPIVSTVIIACLTASPASAPAQNEPRPPDAAALVFFESKIRPVLVKDCYSCHSADTKKGPKGGLLLDTREGLLRGGDSGRAVVPGKPTESLLIKALHGDGVPEMPPKGKLPDEVIADFERWVKMGAPDPRDGKAAVAAGIDIAKGKEFWSFRPVKEPVPPKPGHPIDSFLSAEWEKHGLRPAPEADPRTLVRRLFIDLTGLPPPPEDVEAFVRDPSPAAYERLVDRLLASPRYGERWGRHWLDLARYADSNGKDENLTFHEAYLYRDYVIRSFNADKPFDRFVKEQLAGDLMPAADSRERDELLTATGFLVIGPKVLAERDKPKLRMDVVDEQIDTIGKVFLGLTLGCARCHDHKFDPIPQADYYALAGILMSTRTLNGIKRGNAAVSGWMLRPLGSPEPERVTTARQVYEARLKKVQDEIKAAKAAAAQTKLRALQAEEAAIKQAAPPPRMVMAVQDEAKVEDARINIRGNPHQLGAVVPRGVLRVATVGAGPVMPADQSGRLQLAEWIASPENPLTARVAVNRVWYHLFGRGLVPTVDNFGTSGEKPSHPELLDYLAVRFVKSGWSHKALVREIVLSQAYRLSVQADESLRKADPENRLFARANRRRVEAEVIRDAILTVSGQLDLNGGGPVVSHFPEQAIDNNSQGGFDTDRLLTRAVYLPVIRNDLPPLFEVFDFADPDVAHGRRDTTTVSTQALYLMNSTFTNTHAKLAAERLRGEAADDAARLDRLFRLALGRPPTRAETEKTLAFLADYRKAIDSLGSGQKQKDPELAAWQAVCLSVFGCHEFRFIE